MIKDTMNDFLEYKYWKYAIELLEYEINLINKNNHFNTINLLYFKSLNDSYKNKVKEKEYFDHRITNQAFFGFEDESFNYFYLKPKNEYSNRKISYNSYNIRLIHYSIGLYIADLTQEFFTEFISKSKNIESYYGGKLNYNDNRLILKDSTVYYKEHYRNFKNNISNSVKSKKYNIIIKFDIQNFYDNLDMNILMNKIKNTIKFSIRRDKRFNEFQIKSILDFYIYLMEGKSGIPQGDNDVASAFLSSSYMKYIALDIIDIINKNRINDLIEFKMFQFSDDMYLALKFENLNNEESINKFIKYNIHEIGVKVQEEYKLKFNSKVKVSKIDSDEEIRKFLKELKFTSYIENDLDEDENPQEVFEEILTKLTEFDSLDITELEFEKNKKDILNKSFDYKIKQVLCKKENKNKLEKVLLKFDFNKIYTLQNTIIYLVSYHDKVKTRLLEYLKQTNKFTLKDFSLAIEYICKIDYKYRDEYIQKDLPEKYKKVIDFNKMDYLKIGYLKLGYKEWSIIKDILNLKEQAKNRVIAEKHSNYNFALNHLVNEFKSICNYLHNPKKSEEKYNLIDIQNFLNSKDIGMNKIINITNLFDRRNNNAVSHSNGIPIDELEYDKYKKDVEDILKELINKSKKVRMKEKIITELNN